MDEAALNALAARAQTGDSQGFRQLVEAMGRTLLAVAFRYTGDWEWARDVTQETWLRVFDTLHRYDPARPVKPWILAIHRNGCLSHLRRAWIRLETMPGDDVLADLPAARTSTDPQQDLERREFHDRLLRAVAKLGERQRVVLLRVDLELGDQHTVAQELDMHPTTLRTTLHFARRRLARLLSRDEELA